MITDSLQHQIEQILDRPVGNVRTVSGGSINEAAEITDADGQHFFLKWNSSAPADMFPKEEKGLELLRSAQSGLKCPKVIEADSTDNGTGFILMTFIKRGTGKSGSDRQFGEQLAALHREADDQFGLDYDNYIGRLSQSNKKHGRWINFFIEERLEPQLQMALNDGKFQSAIRDNFNRLYGRLPDLLPEEPASLLHGDLWNGNYCYDSEGSPAVYDPAVYYGNREIEIAFTHLFGGFSTEFYRSYQASFPMEDDFNSRKDIYNLYPLLVHTNMFGGSYIRQVQSIISRF